MWLSLCTQNGCNSDAILFKNSVYASLSFFCCKVSMGLLAELFCLKGWSTIGFNCEKVYYFTTMNSLSHEMEGYH